MTPPPTTPAATTAPRASSLPRASALETAQVVAGVALPLLARGVIVRRPGAVRLAQAADADRTAVRLLQRLRRRHGAGPLRLRVPGRRMVVLLDPGDVLRVLDGTPEPFSAATREKRAALAHFQPHGVLISTGADRADRRRHVEEVLDSRHEHHRDASAMTRAVHEEVGLLVAQVRADGELTWDRFATAWWRAVRRVVLGDGARDDEQLTDDLRALRAAANWAFLHPRRERLRRRFEARLVEHLARAEAGSLAASSAAATTTSRTEPQQQVPQWLFAFDAGAWATYRALALLVAHPEHHERALAESAGVDLAEPQRLPFHRAVLLESLRLWPTTPAVLRETTARVRFPGGPVPEGTLVLTYAPFFHRDDERHAEAHRLTPELWLDGRDERSWPLIPFSDGPAVCPGRNLVLHVGASVLAELARELRLEPVGRRPLQDTAQLPGTFSPFVPRYRVA